MRSSFSTALAALTVAGALAGGCAGNTSATSSQSSSSLGGDSADRSAGASVRSQLGAGLEPAAGSSCDSSSTIGAGASMLPDTKADKTGGTLFVSIGNSAVREFYGSGTDPNPFGTLTAQLGHPRGVSVDSHGTLYVANYDSASGPGDVVEFPEGQDKPTVTLSYQLDRPIFAAADNKGNVYVINDAGGPILIFPPGSSSSPSQLGGFDYPTSLAFDSSWNLYVVDRAYGSSAPLGAVFEIAAGSQVKTNLGLTGLNSPVGIAIDSSNDLFVSNLGNNTVTEYAPGATVPKLTISDGLCYPWNLALNASNDLFVVNLGAPPKGNVLVYGPNSTSPLAALSKLNDPQGVAVNPNYPATPSPKPTRTPKPKPTPTPTPTAVQFPTPTPTPVP